jgi:hypothetical protein
MLKWDTLKSREEKKEEEHLKKVKDPERAVRMRKKSIRCVRSRESINEN